MELSIIDKLVEITRYVFSSFLSIELLLITLLFFSFIFLNIKRNNKLIKIITCVLLVLFVTSLFIIYNDYAIRSIDGVIKWILNYIYFPSMSMYFLIIVFVVLATVYTILNQKITLFLKRVNLVFFGILFLLFINVISIAATNSIDFMDVTQVYTNNTMLSFIQISDMLFVLWVEFILVYMLYKYFQKKYDKDE